MTLGLQEFEPLIRELVSDIAKGHYAKLETDGRSGRVAAADLRRVIAEYGHSLLPLPQNAFELAEVYQVESKQRLDVYLPLWTKAEGRSDLTLFVSCCVKNFQPHVEINDLRVL